MRTIPELVGHGNDEPGGGGVPTGRSSTFAASSRSHRKMCASPAADPTTAPVGANMMSQFVYSGGSRVKRAREGSGIADFGGIELGSPGGMYPRSMTIPLGNRIGVSPSSST